MKIILNTALLCGAILLTTPALAAGAGGTVNGKAQTNADAAAGISTNRVASTGKVGGSVSVGGMTTSGDLDSATAGNNAGSVNAQAQTPARRLAHKAQAETNTATSPPTAAKPQ